MQDSNDDGMSIEGDTITLSKLTILTLNDDWKRWNIKPNDNKCQ